jgi:hypothetical protein
MVERIETVSMHYAHNVCVQVHFHFVKVWRCRPHHHCLRQLLRFQVKGCDRKRRKAVVRAMMPETVAEMTCMCCISLLHRAQARGFPYFETSASSGQNVKEAFDALFQRVLEIAQRK